MTIPKELSYSKNHEWVSVEDNVATIGITEFAVEQLGDITLVEAPDEGESVDAGEVIGTIESVKAVSDLYAPVSGTVVGVNAELEDAPENVNDDPYGAGWLLKIELSEPDEIGKLLDADGYKSHLDSLDE